MISYVSMYSARGAVEERVRNQLLNLAENHAKIFEQTYIAAPRIHIEALARIKYIADPNISTLEKINALQYEFDMNKSNGWKHIIISDTAGRGRSTDGTETDVANFEWFKKSVSGDFF